MAICCLRNRFGVHYREKVPFWWARVMAKRGYTGVKEAMVFIAHRLERGSRLRAMICQLLIHYLLAKHGIANQCDRFSFSKYLAINEAINYLVTGREVE